MDFRVLGPLEIGSPEAAISARRIDRLLLAVLLLRANEPVSVERLLCYLWPDEQPKNPRRALQVAASRVRRVLAELGANDVSLRSQHGCYEMTVPVHLVDVCRFRELASRARSADDDAQRVAFVRSADAEWRGEPLAGLGADLVRAELCQELDELRIELLETSAAARIRLGQVDAVLVTELRALRDAHPFRDRLVEALVTALARSGRVPDALEELRGYRAVLAEELGLDPSHELADLERRLLNGEVPVSEPLPSRVDVPRQLPPDLPHLVGRSRLIDRVKHRFNDGSLARVAVLYGGAGAGKTALAVRLAHQLSAEHEDGALFVSLRGGSGRPVPPEELLARMLRALGVPPSDLPAGVEERSGLWRTLTSSRAILVVLDDAAGEPQVRPLLTPAKRTTVLVTSRRPLLGLEAASRDSVELLDDRASRALLAGRAPSSDSDSAAMKTVLDACGGLPLALRIIGARLAAGDDETLEDVAAMLSDRASRLDWLVAGDLAVRASLEVAYCDCEPQLRSVFDRLGILTSDTFGVWAVSAVCGVSEGTALRYLGRLREIGLVTASGTGVGGRRFRMHDLVRSFAEEKWVRLTPHERGSAITDLIGVSLRLTGFADAELRKGTPNWGVDARVTTSASLEEAVRRAALEWIDQETDLLTDLVLECSGVHPEAAGWLGLRLAHYLAMRDPGRDLTDLFSTCLTALKETGRPILETRLRQERFMSHVARGLEPEELVEDAGRLLASARCTGDERLTVNSLRAVGIANSHNGAMATAQAAYAEALAIAEKLVPATADIVNGVRSQLAEVLNVTGRAVEALEVIRPVLRAADTSRTRAMHLDRFAQIAMDAGALDEAHAALSEIESIMSEVPDEVGRAYVSVCKARHAVLSGRGRDAEVLLAGAQETLERIGFRRGVCRVYQVRAELALGDGDEEAAGKYIDLAVAHAPDRLGEMRARQILELASRRG